MTTLYYLTKRNCKLFFKDKGTFFTSLITPLILLVLYATFLAKIYRDSFVSAMPVGFGVSDALIDATVAGQLISSLLAVSCVTVSFCSNLLMVQDKVNGARRDLTVTPLRRDTLALSYFLGATICTLIVNLVAYGACLLYLSGVGFYMSAGDVFAVLFDVVLLTLFGVAISSCICFPLSTNGQATALGTIVSSVYGFICGAYMPISNFSDGLQKALSFLPGTYGTALLRNHAMRGVYAEMADTGFPSAVIDGIRDSIDCNVYFFGNAVSEGAMYAILCGSIAALLLLYVLLNVFCGKKR